MTGGPWRATAQRVVARARLGVVLPSPRTWWTRIPVPVRVVGVAVVAMLLLPWLARAYAWWWDRAWGVGAFVETVVPRVP